jgi:hypothetical protein
MASAICNSLSYVDDSTFVTLWQMVGDNMGGYGQPLAEVESPYCIFGGAVGLRVVG